MKVYIAADHNGFALKQAIVKKMNVLIDLTKLSKKDDDYPLIAKNLCKKLKKEDKGILICGSGIGMSIAANKFKNIRAALCHNLKDAKSSRNDEDSNVLCLSAEFLTTTQASKIIKKWLSSSFSSLSRHQRRLDQIKEFEKWK